MTLDRTLRLTVESVDPSVCAIAGIFRSGNRGRRVHADPAEDALAKLKNCPGRRSRPPRPCMGSAGPRRKGCRATVGRRRARRRLAAVDAANADLAKFQDAVDRVAAAEYMGGRTDGLDAMLTADSPETLIDQLAVQRVMATEMSAQMQNFKSASDNRHRRRVGVRGVAGRRQDRGRAGRSSARRPAIEASKLQVQIGDRQVAGHPADSAQREALGALRPRLPRLRPRPCRPPTDPSCLLPRRAVFRRVRGPAQAPDATA